MSLLELVLLILAGLILIITAVFATQAASQLAKVSNYQNDPKLFSAYKWLIWASVISWISIVLLAIGVIVYAYSGTTKSWVITLFFFVTLAFLLAIGVLLAIAATDIDNSSRKKEAEQTGARNSAITAVVLALVGGALILIAFISSFFVGTGKEEKKGGEAESKKEGGGSGGKTSNIIPVIATSGKTASVASTATIGETVAAGAESLTPIEAAALIA